MSINNTIEKYWAAFFVALFLFICAVYVAINGQNIVVQIFDNLDSNIAWLKMLKDNHLFLNYDEQVPFLHGLDRIYLYSPLKSYIWLYMIFPVFWAFVIGWFLKIIISVAGFVYLGKILHLDTSKFNKNIIVFCGFLYGITPTFPTSAFSFASLPFVLGFLIEYYRKPNIKYAVLLFLYPIFSDFSFFGFFLLGYLMAFIVLNALITKRMRWYMFYSWLCLAAGYIITEWGLFYTMLFSHEGTIRSEMLLDRTSFDMAWQLVIETFIFGQLHICSEHTMIVFPACLFYFFYLLFTERKNIFKNYWLWIMMLLILNSLFFGLDRYEGFRRYIGAFLPVLKGFSFGRVLWLSPFLWYFAFMILLCRIKWQFKYIYDLKFFLCICAFLLLICSDSIYNIIKYNFDYQIYKTQDLHTRRGVIKQKANGENYSILTNREVTYSEFYSEKLFDKVKKTIGYNGEWSIAYGFHPAVLEYNQIKTIDGMLSYYPLKYKREFRTLIAPFLEQHKWAAYYFDKWGGRAYVFSENRIFEYININTSKTLQFALKINTDVFKKLEGKYIFSRFLLTNAKELNLDFIAKFEDENSPYKIYVYAI